MIGLNNIDLVDCGKDSDPANILASPPNNDTLYQTNENNQDTRQQLVTSP